MPFSGLLAVLLVTVCDVVPHVVPAFWERFGSFFVFCMDHYPVPYSVATCYWKYDDKCLGGINLKRNLQPVGVSR